MSTNANADVERGNVATGHKVERSAMGAPGHGATGNNFEHSATGAPGHGHGATGNNYEQSSTGAPGNAGTGHDFGRSAIDASASRQMALQGGGVGIRRIGNPGPLGLFSLASTLLMYSLYTVNVRHVRQSNIIVGMALAFGGLVQLLAGQWQFVCGNTFGATVFSSYGGFWISLALIYLPGTGILAAYGSGNENELHNALGVYFITWFIVTFLFLIAAIRTHLAHVSWFGFLTLTFMLLAIGQFLESTKTTKAGGAFGIVTAFIVFYAGASQLITRETSYFTLPVMRFGRRID